MKSNAGMKFPFESVRLILNPTSGRRKAGGFAREIAAALSAAGLDVGVFETEKAGDAVRYARESAGASLVVAIGGDGTINEIVNGLPEGVPLAVFPMGTGNVLQHELSLPNKVDRFLEMLSVAKFRKLDLLATPEKKFVLMAGVGLDAEIVEAFHSARTGPVTKLHYLKPAISAFRSHKAPELQVAVDGEDIYEGPANVIVSNVRFYAGSLAPAMRAVPNDGLLDVVVFGANTRLKIVEYVLAMLTDDYETHSQIKYRQGRAVVIKCVRGSEPARVQIDGDPAGTTPLEIEALPRALTVVVP